MLFRLIIHNVHRVWLCNFTNSQSPIIFIYLHKYLYLLIILLSNYVSKKCGDLCFFPSEHSVGVRCSLYVEVLLIVFPVKQNETKKLQSKHCHHYEILLFNIQTRGIVCKLESQFMVHGNWPMSSTVFVWWDTDFKVRTTLIV